MNARDEREMNSAYTARTVVWTYIMYSWRSSVSRSKLAESENWSPKYTGWLELTVVR